MSCGAAPFSIDNVVRAKQELYYFGNVSSGVSDPARYCPYILWLMAINPHDLESGLGPLQKYMP